MLGKARKRSKNDALRRKRHLSVRVLEKMQATHHPGEPDTPLEYTTYWMELVDHRGGLFMISDKVYYKLTEGVEMIVREDGRWQVPAGNRPQRIHMEEDT